MVVGELHRLDSADFRGNRVEPAQAQLVLIEELLLDIVQILIDLAYFLRLVLTVDERGYYADRVDEDEDVDGGGDEGAEQSLVPRAAPEVQTHWVAVPV